MLTKFIHVCDLLQPGAGYGSTPQDYTAWYQALAATNIAVWEHRPPAQGAPPRRSCRVLNPR
jgi:hypothetical protein